MLTPLTVFALATSSPWAPCEASTLVDLSSYTETSTCVAASCIQDADQGAFIQTVVTSQLHSEHEHDDRNGLADQPNRPEQAEGSGTDHKQNTELLSEAYGAARTSSKASLSSVAESSKSGKSFPLTEAKGKWWIKIQGPHAEKGLDHWDSFDTILIASMGLGLVLFDSCVLPLFPCNFISHVVILFFMLICSGWFLACVWWQRGETDGLAWATSYAVEWALSLDNLFIFHLVFKAYSVPNSQSSRALNVGIYGAVFFRILFIIGFTQLFKLNYIVDIVVGVILVLSGLFSMFDEEEGDVQKLYSVRFFKKVFGSRLQDTYSDSGTGEGHFFARNEDGKLQMTVLFLVVCVISVVDIVFAFDSVGAKTGQIKSAYINVSSCLMAMFSLRSMFFIIRDITEYFDYVKYGISAILCFVGVEMIISKWYTVPLGTLCVVILSIFGASVLASVAKGAGKAAAKKEEISAGA